jgi:molybdopterin-guanine dinucleotide biosynthesis protein A
VSPASFSPAVNQGGWAAATRAGKPLLAHAIERLKPQVGDLVLNANGEPSRFASLGLPVIADSVPDHAGLLPGVQAGLA